jgi:ribosomal protein L19E
MDPYDDEWGRKGATLSDKTARTEFGLTQDEIIAAIRAGKLQYRQAAMHGNPWLRLLRREVEELVSTRHGEGYLREQQARTELKRVNRELKQLRAQLTALEERRTVLLSELAELFSRPGQAAGAGPAIRLVRRQLH